MIKLYNTLTRKKEVFKPINDRQVGIYSCGPTVYWNQHIGHMYAYVQWDLLVRFFRFVGYKVTWAMNITDVGHLTSDEDTGEDKMEKGAKREGLSVWEVSDKYMTQFMDSLSLLNIKKPDIVMRATDNINAQISLAKKIEKNGYTYETKKGLVFDTSKFSDYAKFANLNLGKLKKRKDVMDDSEKKNPWDFFLWAKDNNHIMKWESPWGVGYPGWHIECTAMSTKALGKKFDIHTGGIEHIGVHHTNEIAQGWGAFKATTANYWLHNAWLLGQGGVKMSKSLGNFLTTQEIAKKGFDPMALRYLFLNSHYRKGLNFSFEALQGASESLNNLRKITAGLRDDKTRTSLSSDKLSRVKDFNTEFVGALSDDLNIPKALAVIWKVIKSNIPPSDKYDLIISFDEVMGLKLALYVPEEIVVDHEIKKLIEKRDEYRRIKNFSKADEIRKKIEEKGYTVEDSSEGQTVKKKINNQEIS